MLVFKFQFYPCSHSRFLTNLSRKVCRVNLDHFGFVIICLTLNGFYRHILRFLHKCECVHYNFSGHEYGIGLMSAEFMGVLWIKRLFNLLRIPICIPSNGQLHIPMFLSVDP